MICFRPGPSVQFPFIVPTVTSFVKLVNTDSFVVSDSASYVQLSMIPNHPLYCGVLLKSPYRVWPNTIDSHKHSHANTQHYYNIPCLKRFKIVSSDPDRCTSPANVKWSSWWNIFPEQVTVTATARPQKPESEWPDAKQKGKHLKDFCPLLRLFLLYSFLNCLEKSMAWMEIILSLWSTIISIDTMVPRVRVLWRRT